MHRRPHRAQEPARNSRLGQAAAARPRIARLERFRPSSIPTRRLVRLEPAGPTSVLGDRRYGSPTPLLANGRKLTCSCGQPVSLCRRVPACRHIEIARHPVTGLIELRQIIFGARVAVRSRARVPQSGLRRVASRTGATIKHYCQVEFAKNVSGFGGATVPGVGRCCVLPNAFPKVIEQPELEGGPCITPFRSRPPYP